MPATIINGTDIATAIKIDVAKKVAARHAKGLSTPGLAVILIGDNTASETYVHHKQQACKQAGIFSICHRLPATVDQKEIISLINTLNQDAKIHGILLQLPLPKHIQADALLECIDPKKDVDGFHPYNLGRLVQRRPLLRPCTPFGVITLLESTGETIAGKHAVVVGASNIVGRPMVLELLLAKCTVTVCHRFTNPLSTQVQAADILISATGQHGLIQSDWIKPGAIVIDVGFSRLDNGKITGDIDFDTAKLRAGFITPVPGGVGPMTVATLLQNTLMATEMAD